MKLTKQTPTQIVIQEKVGWGGRIVPMLAVLVLMGVPPWLGLRAYRHPATHTITCNRIETTLAGLDQPLLVNCEITETRLFGLQRDTFYTLSDIREATIETETREDDDGGTYYVHRVALLAGDAQAYPAMPFRRDKAAVLAIADRLNAELATTNPTWTIHSRSPWNHFFLGPFQIICLMFAGGLGWFAIKQFRSRTLTLNRQTQRLTDESRALGQRQTQEFPLSNVELQYIEARDSDDDPVYRLDLVTPESTVRLAETYNQKFLQPWQPLHSFVGSVKTVTGGQAAPVGGPSLGAMAHSRPLYAGQIAQFSTTGLTAMPESESAAVQQAARSLQLLNFAWLGDVQMDKFTNDGFYAFGSADQLTAAIVMRGNFFFVDFYTRFADGASLTTTFNKAGNTNHHAAQKIYRYKYPGLTISQVFERHQQHLKTLQVKHGRPVTVKPDAGAIAQAIDDFLVRDFSGWKKWVLWLF